MDDGSTLHHAAAVAKWSRDGLNPRPMEDPSTPPPPTAIHLDRLEAIQEEEGRSAPVPEDAPARWSASLMEVSR